MKDRYDDDFPRVSRPDSKGRKDNKMRQFIKQVAVSPEVDDVPEDFADLAETFERRSKRARGASR